MIINRNPQTEDTSPDSLGHRTIGYVCTIARYSVLHDSDQLFAAKYMTYMPTEEELRREIEQQKQFFLLQHKGDNYD